MDSVAADLQELVQHIFGMIDVLQPLLGLFITVELSTRFQRSALLDPESPDSLRVGFLVWVESEDLVCAHSGVMTDFVAACGRVEGSVNDVLASNLYFRLLKASSYLPA